MSDAYLEHFGVKGMRWGVRKDKQKAERTPEQARAAKIERNARIRGGWSLIFDIF